LLTIRNTSSIFRDAKIEFRKPPSFLWCLFVCGPENPCQFGR
jgi:hypothetical protein